MGVGAEGFVSGAQSATQVGTSVDRNARALYSPVSRLWFWVHSNKIHIYPIFYLLKGDYGRMVKYHRGTWGTWAGTAAASACTAAPAVENRDWTSGLGIGAESLGLQSL